MPKEVPHCNPNMCVAAYLRIEVVHGIPLAVSQCLYCGRLYYKKEPRNASQSKAGRS